jgi:hypothetical protein
LMSITFLLFQTAGTLGVTKHAVGVLRTTTNAMLL